MIFSVLLYLLTNGHRQTDGQKHMCAPRSKLPRTVRFMSNPFHRKLKFNKGNPFT